MTLLDAASMPHTFKVERVNHVKDDGMLGTREGTPIAIVTGKKGWLQNSSMNQVVEFDKRDEVIVAKLLMPEKHDIRPGDVVTITAGPANVNDDYLYYAQDDRSAGNGILFTALLMARNNERHATYA